MQIKKLFAARDMTEGAPWQRIVEFALPMLIGNMAQQLYNTVDSIVVGRYVGDNALAAVGSAAPILNLLLALLVGISTGAGIVVSQSFGAKDREGLSVAIGNCITLSAIATVIIMIIGPIITRPMLTMLKTPDSIIDWCTQYLQIYFLGIVGFFFYNMLSGILRGLGDSMSALIYLLVACVLNIILDLMFVVWFGMTTDGVAWATINVNSFPMVVEMCTGADVGKYTGYYYTFSMAAQVLTPILSGALLEHVGYWTLFPYGALFVAAAFVTMLFVRHGDNRPEAKKGLEAFDVED